MKAATRLVPDPLIVKRQLVEGDLFIRALSLGQSVNETFTGTQILHWYQTKGRLYFAIP